MTLTDAILGGTFGLLLLRIGGCWSCPNKGNCEWQTSGPLAAWARVVSYGDSEPDAEIDLRADDVQLVFRHVGTAVWAEELVETAASTLGG